MLSYVNNKRARFCGPACRDGFDVVQVLQSMDGLTEEDLDAANIEGERRQYEQEQEEELAEEKRERDAS